MAPMKKTAMPWQEKQFLSEMCKKSDITVITKATVNLLMGSEKVHRFAHRKWPDTESYLVKRRLKDILKMHVTHVKK